MDEVEGEGGREVEDEEFIVGGGVCCQLEYGSIYFCLLPPLCSSPLCALFFCATFFVLRSSFSLSQFLLLALFFSCLCTWVSHVWCLGREKERRDVLSGTSFEHTRRETVENRAER